MKLENKYNLPEPVYEAIKNDEYDSGDSDITVTQLISPIKLVELQRRHKTELSEDAADRLWATYGQVMHKILERAIGKNELMKERYLIENRLFTEINGWKVSGQFDLYDKKEDILFDYKFVGGFAVKMAMREGKPEWETQLNCLRWLFFKNTGIIAKSVSIVGMVRDWTEKSQGEGIPPISIIPFEAWDIEKAESFIKDRVDMFQQARLLPDALLPSCTDEERWFRNGKNARCLRYCPSRTVCNFGKSLIKGE